MADFITSGADINVEEIMTAIQGKISERLASGAISQRELDEIAHLELNPIADPQDIPKIYQANLFAFPGSAPGADNGQTAAVVDPPWDIPRLQLDAPGPGLKGLVMRILRPVRRLFGPLMRFLTRPLYVELMNEILDTRHNLHDLRREEQMRVYSTSAHQILRSQEYIKILHNATTNLVTELSVLRIEQEKLRTTVKALEDKLEFVENRARMIEKKLLPE
jgi:hypothetical protein